ncbi:hypothetical protein J6Q66_08825 [bacterium]|nr:hypothetical protein [bacterium]
MKVKATKTFAKFLNDNIKGVEIKKIELTERFFGACVDFDTFDHEIDFDYKTNRFNVIVVNYPSNFYAVPTYLTTKDLTKLYNKSNGTTTDLIEKIKEYIEI